MLLEVVGVSSFPRLWGGGVVRKGGRCDERTGSATVRTHLL